MEQIWYVVNTIKTGSSFAAIVLLILFIIKFKDSFFKYILLMLGVVNFFSTFYAIIITTHTATGDEWLFSLWGGTVQILTIPLLYIWVQWTHKTINKPPPFPVHIASIAIPAGLTLYFITQLLFFDITKLLVPLIAAGVVISYSMGLILTNIQSIPLEPARKYFKFFIILLAILLTTGWGLSVFRTELLDRGLFYLTRIFHSIATTVLNSLVLLFAGKYFFNPQTSKKNQTLPEDFARRHNLTQREEILINLILTGKTAKEIGTAMNITTQTAKNYRYKLYQKLDIRNKIDLVNMVKNKMTGSQNDGNLIDDILEERG